MFAISLSPKIQDFVTLFLSITAEAFPFVVLGVLLSVLVGVFVKTEWLLRILPKNRVGSHFLISFLGILMPVCECGNIPVARRLISKGFTVSQSITFLLAAPIINIVTFISTRDAFALDPAVLYMRMVSGFVIAFLVGVILSYKVNQEEWSTEKFVGECKHEHECEHSSSKFQQAIEIFRLEFFSVMKMLVLGAFFAAISQNFIPRDVILAFGQDPILSILIMIALSLVISICSNVDAFFAMSYVGTFTKGSLVSFLVFGPMIDIKILTMMSGFFKKSLLVLVIALVFAMSLMSGLITNLYF